MSPRGRELVSDAVKLLTSYGFAPVIDERGKHPKLRWINNQGHRCFLVIARSPSGSRHRANAKATLRRILRLEGGPTA